MTTRSHIREARAVLSHRPLKFGDEEQIRALQLLERVEALRRLLWRAGLRYEDIDAAINAADENGLRRLEIEFREEAAA